MHALTGFQNGTLNIDAGGNVTVNQGSFAGTIEGAGQLTMRKTAATCCRGAVDGANRRYHRRRRCVCFRWKATRTAALGHDPQSIVLNGGVLDLSDFSTWQSGTSYNDGLEVSGSSGTVIGSQDVVDSAGGNDMHIGGDGKDGVYVVVDAVKGRSAWQMTINTSAQHKSPPVR
ncbi:hypothetical protein ACVXHA_19745 [Escherichia coli]